MSELVWPFVALVAWPFVALVFVGAVFLFALKALERFKAYDEQDDAIKSIDRHITQVDNRLELLRSGVGSVDALIKAVDELKQRLSKLEMSRLGRAG
jgi:hypothetical protein